MDRSRNTRSGTQNIGGTEIYYEVRGSGPAVLFIPGATGDAGHFQESAGRLASEYTVVTYDRPGNSRSRTTAPASLDRQADAAAALLRDLGLAPATVFGTSGGAIIALALAMRTPGVVRALVVHEPPFVQALPDADALGAELKSKIEEGFARGGARGAMELFVRENAGSDTFDRIEPALRERMLANGEWFFGHELPMFMSWLPTPADLRSLRMPVRVAAGRENRGNYHYRAAEWLASQLAVELVEIPGIHAPYLAQPQEFADALLPLLTAEAARAL